MWWIFITMICFHFGETKLESTTDFPFVTEVMPLPVIIPQNTCFEDLGCFYNGFPFYDSVDRPCSCTPDYCLMTQYLLFTNTNPNDAYQLSLTEESIAASPINPNLQTKILIHGFLVDLTENDARFKMKNELLRSDSFNVIIIDWTKHNKKDYYQAVANGRVVGARIAKLLTLCVKTKGMNLEKVHIIGHSLGAHIAGWVGERLDKVARISGLDPAGPCFYNAPNIVRLDTTDADFVDIIHTNGGSSFIGGYGLYQAIGHMDFFPNGGQWQKGCLVYEMEETRMENSKSSFSNSCSHNRASELYIESIRGSECSATLCENYDDFLNEKCTDSTISVMGHHTKKLVGLKESSRFFLTTSRKSQYCKLDDIFWYNLYDRYNVIDNNVIDMD